MAPITSTIEIDRPAAEAFAYATDPRRFAEWQKGVVDGKMDGPAEQIGARGVTTRRLGMANRPTVSELVRNEPPTAWGVRGIDGRSGPPSI
jgi:hypothetical protein